MVRPPAGHSHAAAATAVGRQSAETGTESCSQFSVDPKNADKTGGGKIGRVSQQFSADPKYQRDPLGRFVFEPVSRGDGFAVYEGKLADGLIHRFVCRDSDAEIAEQPREQTVVEQTFALPPAALGRIANSIRTHGPGLQASAAGRKWLLKRRAVPFQRPRVASCRHKRVVRNSVQIRTDGKAVSIVGVETCASARDCPVCAPNIYLGRAEEIKHSTRAWRAKGGLVVMLTLTARHKGITDLEWLGRRVSRAWSRMRRSRRFDRWWRGELGGGVRWVIRGDDQTHGKNGWHPHLHVLLFLHRQPTSAELDYIYERWSECVQSELGSAFVPNREHGVHVKHSTDDAYLEKLGLEVAHITAKSGRQDGQRTPWELLQDACDGDHGAADLWQEHSKAMLGRRQIGWSRGMKQNFQVDQRSDAELADEQLSFGEPWVCYDIAAWLWDFFRYEHPIWLPVFIDRLRNDPDSAVDLLPRRDMTDSSQGIGWARHDTAPMQRSTGPPERSYDERFARVRRKPPRKWEGLWADVRDKEDLIRKVKARAAANQKAIAEVDIFWEPPDGARPTRFVQHGFPRTDQAESLDSASGVDRAEVAALEGSGSRGSCPDAQEAQRHQTSVDGSVLARAAPDCAGAFGLPELTDRYSLDVTDVPW